ncbi:hypothetical protein CDAR_44861 [Caerostris darwini]|uniref:RING-type domain-containing protein n=1 Tax=Caerostris darwini TaxID=1538125 RepID=A0AAV4WST5_9ARAC|nr:hypothetical protein CDAR_44861 [Caerostris darwini]
MRCSCVICSDLFDTGIVTVTIPCGHVFHFRCLSKWMALSKTCPQCRRRVCEKDITKLFFNIVSSNDRDPTNLENRLNTLKVQLSIKDIKLEASKKKIKELQMHASDVEQSLRDMQRNKLQLESDSSILKKKLTILNIKYSNLKIKQKNEHEHMNRIDYVEEDSNQQVEDILREMRITLPTERIESAAVRKANYCCVMKRKLTHLIQERRLLEKEVKDIKICLASSKTEIQILKEKLTLLNHGEGNIPKKFCVQRPVVLLPKTEVSGNISSSSKIIKKPNSVTIDISLPGIKKTGLANKVAGKSLAPVHNKPEQNVLLCKPPIRQQQYNANSDSFSRHGCVRVDPRKQNFMRKINLFINVAKLIKIDPKNLHNKQRKTVVISKFPGIELSVLVGK